MNKPIAIAIDGPAGAGKSTLARRLAARLGFLYIDTGAMYRAVALEARRRQIGWDEGARLEELASAMRIELTPDGRVVCDGADVSQAIRAPEISEGASRVSAVAGVRRAMVREQQKMGAAADVVMEGRDIGTVVFPEAAVKIYLDASPEVRARRRVDELSARGAAADYEVVFREMKQRDERDTTRPDSPLRQAEGAVYLDSSGLSEQEVEEALLRIVRERAATGEGVES